VSYKEVVSREEFLIAIPTRNHSSPNGTHIRNHQTELYNWPEKQIALPQTQCCVIIVLLGWLK